MDYRQAKKIREKSFGTLFAEQEGGVGQSLKSAISQKTKAKVTGIKETFDPLNIAKKLTGGSNWAPAMLGKMIGSDKKRIDYFSGVKPKHTADLESSESSGSLNSPKALESLGYIYKSLKQSIDDKHQAETQAKEAKQKEEDDENTRNEELVKALTGRRKKKEKPYRDEKGRFAKRPTEEKPSPTKESPKTTGGAPTKPTEAPKTPAPSSFKPNPARTATPTTSTPSVSTVTSTATKIPTPTGMLKYGYLTAAGMAAVTSAHEGNAESVYGDYKDKKTGELKNQFSDRPEVWSEKTLGQKKKLTDFTFSELLQYQKYRNSIKESSGAVGIAGFMPSTIFGQKLDGQVGLFKQSGLSWNDKFTEDNQKLLKGVLDEADDKILGPGLKRLGINTGITPGMKIASNYVGASGLLWVIEEGQKDPSISVKDALIKRDPKHRDPTRGGTINNDLATILAKDFVESKEQFAIKKATQLGLVNNVGNQMDSSSKENKNLKADASTNDKAAPVVNSNTTNQNTQQQSSSQKPGDDSGAYMKKVKM